MAEKLMSIEILAPQRHKEFSGKQVATVRGDTGKLLLPTPYKQLPPRRLKDQFTRFAERFGHMLSRLLLTVLYATLVLPGGLLMSLFQDPLRVKRYRGTKWTDWKRSNDTLDRARRQD